MMKFLLVFFILLFPALASAAGMSKQDACAYPDGIHYEEVYVLWPGKLPQIDAFLKKDGFLYYFIHTFPDTESLAAYRDAGNRDMGIIKNSGSYFVSYDCARSKVKFHPQVRSTEGTTYGKLHWIHGSILDYSLTPRSRRPCTTPPDSLIMLPTLRKLSPDTRKGIPRTTSKSCVARSQYKVTTPGLIEWETEEQDLTTKESFYTKYSYTIATDKIRKISTTELDAASKDTETTNDTIDYRIYKKDIIPEISVTQTDTHTQIRYKGKPIKTYVNAEFPTELLTHGPDEEPDCYNSLAKSIPSTRAKDIVGKEYLRSCLVLKTERVGSRYILFYGPGIGGNRLSFYDIKMKKFYHNLINTILDAKVVLDAGLVLFSKETGSYCGKRVSIYEDGALRTLFDECSLASSGIPLISIEHVTVDKKTLTILYTPYKTLTSGDMVLDTSLSSRKIINF